MSDPSVPPPWPESASAVPPEHAALARRLRAAEDRIFPLAMIDTDRYQRAVRLVGALHRRLIESCHTIDELSDATEQVRFWLRIVATDEGIPLAGLDADLVADAAMSQRFRTLLAEQAAELRDRRIEQARASGQAWSVLEEPDPAAWGTGSARWVETHVTTGTVMVRSVEADPVTGAATYRLEVFGGSADRDGDLPGVRSEDFADRDAWLARIAEVRRGLSES
jgi:hypothetical protein